MNEWDGSYAVTDPTPVFLCLYVCVCICVNNRSLQFQNVTYLLNCNRTGCLLVFECRFSSLASLSLQTVIVAADRGHSNRGECCGHCHCTQSTRFTGVTAGCPLQVLANTVHTLQRQFLQLILSMLACHRA